MTKRQEEKTNGMYVKLRWNEISSEKKTHNENEAISLSSIEQKHTKRQQVCDKQQNNPIFIL